jgi:hypothetical protein
VCEYYFSKYYNLDISVGLETVIGDKSKKEQDAFRNKFRQLESIQSLFQEYIGKVYMNEYSSERNCSLLIDILLGVPMERLLKIYCYFGKNKDSFFDCVCGLFACFLYTRIVKYGKQYGRYGKSASRMDRYRFLSKYNSLYGFFDEIIVFELGHRTLLQ